MIKEIYFSSKGRINRWRYFKYSLLFDIILFVLIFFGTMAIGILRIGDGLPAMTRTLQNFNAIIYMLSLIPFYFLNVKRLHDLNKGNTLAIIILMMSILLFAGDENVLNLPIVMLPASIVFFVLGLYLLFKKGTDGLNEYGTDPLKKY